MRLIMWNAIVEGWGGHAITGLTLEALVKCPNADCKKEVTIRSKNELLLPIEGMLAGMIRSKVNKLIAQRTCTHCGTVSEMPRRDSKRLLAEVMENITSVWIEEQVAAVCANEKPNPVEEPD